MIESKQKSQPDIVVLGRILITVTLFIAMMVGVRSGLAALVPADWCGGVPVDPVVYVLSAVLALGVALPANRSGIGQIARLAALMFPGLLLAVLAAQLTAGCVPTGTRDEGLRIIVEAGVMNAILIPLALFHRHFVGKKIPIHLSD